MTTEVAPPLTASLELAASLLDAQRPDRSAAEPLVLDVEVGGYRWQVTRRADESEPPLWSTGLSPREVEVVRMVAAGFTNRAIANVLEISPWTVGTYLRRIFSKLDVNCRAAMVALMVERGMRSASALDCPG